jgi:hypothetical protein
MSATPPGWYPSDDGLRWWNGHQWADPPALPPPPAASAPEDARTDVREPAGSPAAQRLPEGSLPLPGGRGPRGRIVGLVVAAVLGISFLAAVAAERESSTSDLEPVAAVTGPADGCARFLDLTVEIIEEKLDDDAADARYARLQRAAQTSDILLAGDLQDIRDADSAADVSAASQIIMRRCIAAGHLTQSDVQRILTAGASLMGIAPSPTPRPVQVAAPVPTENADATTDVEPLSSGEPACAEVLPMLERHRLEIEEWLEYFEGGFAGTPWARGRYVTLYSVSPETGDPIRQTLSMSDALLDDFDLNEAAFGDDVPDYVHIDIENGTVSCTDYS